MKIISRIPSYDPSKASLVCDLCGKNEIQTRETKGRAKHFLLPMFKCEEEGVEYTLCGECVDKEAGVE